jgi:hypothetical protein
MVSGSTGQNASGEGVMSLGQNAWNIADGYTKIKLLKILIELDLYEEMANFGFRSDDPNFNYNVVPNKRIEGLQRMIFSLRQLVGNSNFAITDKSDKEVMKGLLLRIDNVEVVLDGISDISYNDVTKEEILMINEDHFMRCLKILRSIKDDLNFPINRAGLIFRKGEETNIDEFMKSIYEG